MKTLIIIDPQNDFISGTLPVPNAFDGMNLLADHLNQLDLDHLVVTMDCHPIRHCSFVEQGGLWPAHCVKYSHGAAIFEPLMTALQHLPNHVAIHYLEKGVDLNEDQYSAFGHAVPDCLLQSDTIYVAGLAGDVCVMNSLKDLVKHGLADRIVCLTDVSPSLDDGSTLRALLAEHQLKSCTLKS